MGVGRVIGKVGKSVLEPAYHSVAGPVKGLNDAMHYVAGAVSEGPVRWGGKAAGWAAKKTLVKKVDPSLSNGYTGYKMSAFGNHATGWGAMGVAVAGGAMMGHGSMPGLEGVQTRANKVGEVSYGGHPAVMDADGMGSPSQAPSLGASGSLVFGLHNGRKG